MTDSPKFVTVPEDTIVLCPKCEGKKGFNIPYPERPSQAFWEYCADCRGTGKILASRLSLMLSNPLAASVERRAVLEALRKIIGVVSYPVATEINPRGWAERSIDASGSEHIAEIALEAIRELAAVVPAPLSEGVEETLKKIDFCADYLKDKGQFTFGSMFVDRLKDTLASAHVAVAAASGDVVNPAQTESKI